MIRLLQLFVVILQVFRSKAQHFHLELLLQLLCWTGGDFISQSQQVWKAFDFSIKVFASTQLLPTMLPPLLLPPQHCSEPWVQRWLAARLSSPSGTKTIFTTFIIPKTPLTLQKVSSLWCPVWPSASFHVTTRIRFTATWPTRWLLSLLSCQHVTALGLIRIFPLPRGVKAIKDLMCEGSCRCSRLQCLKIHWAAMLLAWRVRGKKREGGSTQAVWTTSTSPFPSATRAAGLWLKGPQRDAVTSPARWLVVVRRQKYFWCSVQKWGGWHVRHQRRHLSAAFCIPRGARRETKQIAAPVGKICRYLSRPLGGVGLFRPLFSLFFYSPQYSASPAVSHAAEMRTDLISGGRNTGCEFQ